MFISWFVSSIALDACTLRRYHQDELVCISILSLPRLIQFPIIAWLVAADSFSSGFDYLLLNLTARFQEFRFAVVGSWRMIPGALKSVGRWTSCRTLLERRFAQERPSSTDDKPKDSGCQLPVKATTIQEPNSGEIPTPSLLKATSTKDFILSVREERLRQKAKEKDEEVDVLKLQQTFSKGKSTPDLDSG